MQLFDQVIFYVGLKHTPECGDFLVHLFLPHDNFAYFAAK